jgi:hypothetical protein
LLEARLRGCTRFFSARPTVAALARSPLRSMLTFSWPKTRWNRTPLPGLILLSALVHGLAFVLLQVVPKEKATAPEREREIELLSADIPEHQALLAAVEAESPLAALSHQLLPVEDLLSRPKLPASSQSHTPPLEPQLWRPAAGSLVAGLLSAKRPAPETEVRPEPARIELSRREQERLGTIPPLPGTPKGRLLENPEFLLGIGGEGTVQFVLLQKSCGDEAADRLVERALRRMEFKGGQRETQWGTATFIWGQAGE